MNNTRLNFSKEQTQVYELANDLSHDNYSAHVDGDKVAKKDLENYLREKIKTDLLHGASLYSAYRRNNLILFEVMEEMVNTALEEDVLNNPFIEAMVETKNRRLGDRTEFYSEGGLLSVARFSGNHWDTNRQSLDLGDSVNLPKEWLYIHVYEELERFLLGYSSLEKIMDKIYKSFAKFMNDRLYVQFNNVANAVPEGCTKNGNSQEALLSLCSVIKSKGGYDSLVIAGTSSALENLLDIIPEKQLAESQKEALAKTGSITDWRGYKLITIPQTVRETAEGFEPMINDKQLFIMGDTVKPIKLELIGDTRSDIDTEGKRNNDQTVDIQVQTMIGLGLLMPAYFGLFNFA